jgi:quercetin dioxygenase-like cupin family protein
LAAFEIKEITLAARQETRVHLHPCPVVGHITEGSILFQVEDQPRPVLKAGDASSRRRMLECGIRQRDG